ncbi:MAG: diadenylate cyclase CdaA [Acidobacteriota bacterium]|nr:diadenylate cyclase CdaA [Blastocatellia bacterium]MDW8240171.1 diadenylate cyclase CdaA [Acidobacteriota bacterium]
MNFTRLFAQISYRDVLDVAAVALIIYGLLKPIKGTRAIQIVYGVLVVWLIHSVAVRYELRSLEFLLRHALLYLGFVIIVIFQSELRSALIQFGKYVPQRFGFRQVRLSRDEFMVEEVILAATTLSAQRIGALIVFERDVSLEHFMDTGVRLDARVSYDLLVTIFNTRAPLHDGAVIIRKDRIAAASCFLPLTLNPYLSKELGTRHRAAIGITEDTDAVALVVSEETGITSLAMNGEIKRHLDAAQLRLALHEVLLPPRRYRREAAAETSALTMPKPILTTLTNRALMWKGLGFRSRVSGTEK